VSQKATQESDPVKIVLSDSFYEIILHKRAQDNERLIAQGLPPRTDAICYISESEAEILAQAEAARHSTQAADRNAPPALPRPSRGLRAAAKAKVAERAASIPNFQRHSRKCQICRSPFVDDIEQLYLQWQAVDLICRFFRLADTDTLYRHARAAGLDVLRRQNSRWVVEQFIEQWRTVKITSSTVIRSIRALSCLDEKGRWTDPPRTHILVRGTDPQAPELALPEMESGGPLPPSTAQPEPCCLPRSASLASGHRTVASSSSTERSEPSPPRVGKIEEDAAFPHSFEQREPRHGGSAAFCAKETEENGAMPPSSERSEPYENGSGLPCPGAVSTTDCSENRTVVASSSTEQCEPKKKKPAKSLPGTGALHRHKTKNVSDPNRVSTGN